MMLNAMLVLLMLQAGCVPVGAGANGTVVIDPFEIAFHVWVCPGLNPIPDKTEEAEPPKEPSKPHKDL